MAAKSEVKEAKIIGKNIKFPRSCINDKRWVAYSDWNGDEYI